MKDYSEKSAFNVKVGKSDFLRRLHEVEIVILGVSRTVMAMFRQ